jgi:hypothetical protein
VLDVVPGGAHAFCVLSARGYALRGGARIGYVMPWAARVQVEVFEATGRLVRRLGRDEVEGAGERARRWDGLDDRGANVPPGLYFAPMRRRRNHASAGTPSMPSSSWPPTRARART